MTRGALMLLLTGVMLNAIAQLSLKAATRITGPVFLQIDTFVPTLARLGAQPMLWVGLACYGMSVLVWIAALSRVQVSVAYPMLSLGYVVTTLSAWWLWDETLGVQRLAALTLIVIGVCWLAQT